ncbi:hypothetical protein C9374_004107 [Naegleria lovaniensis]|uniref:Beta-amylase n=1 Tax=Naegleria lovaniensis TaxID=51637 RepID=A0AA88KP84_NAELO|nr:uncharacterized protein C9374_004107 [Naegleria lovaniensis]KAG2383436.1 hypothetical protein C9374_004107 [Naegleria lovaniensis]
MSTGLVMTLLFMTILIEYSTVLHLAHAYIPVVGTDGIMIDVWWGLVEKQPRQYNFAPYRQLFQLCQQVGLQVEAVLSFHQCGTNVGDSTFIPLPQWVLQVGKQNPDIFYTDQTGHRDEEYLSLGVDLVPLFPSSANTSSSLRTAVDLYEDFMKAFRQEFQDLLQNGVMKKVEVGLGPAGELRYPSYQLQNNLWSFPGIGAFQCYDKYMLSNLSISARNIGHANWGYAGPNNAGYYNSMPWQTAFFSDNGGDNYNSPYGKFFLQWYSGMLIQHGANVLSRARNVFGPNVELSAKVAGIHWWYFTSSHAAELTAGYYNTPYYNGYKDIAIMFSRYRIGFEFTCLEMTDNSQPSYCQCGPQELVALTRDTAWQYGVSYGGENALPMDGNYGAIDQVVKQSSANGKVIESFTYLRLNDGLVYNSYNFNAYAQLVSRLHALSGESFEKLKTTLKQHGRHDHEIVKEMKDVELIEKLLKSLTELSDSKKKKNGRKFGYDLFDDDSLLTFN